MIDLIYILLVGAWLCGIVALIVLFFKFLICLLANQFIHRKDEAIDKAMKG